MTVIRLATTNETPVKRACGTCRHREGRHGIGQECGALGDFASVARSPGRTCGPEGSLWEPSSPPPPRRSLRRWLYETLWA